MSEKQTSEYVVWLGFHEMPVNSCQLHGVNAITCV